MIIQLVKILLKKRPPRDRWIVEDINSTMGILFLICERDVISINE